MARGAGPRPVRQAVETPERGAWGQALVWPQSVLVYGRALDACGNIRIPSKNFLTVPNLDIDLWTEFLCMNGYENWL